MDPRCAPQRVHCGHLANQCADVGWHARPPRAMSTLPGPEQTKATPMPRQHGGWLHDVERRAPAVPSLRQPCPQHTVSCGEPKPWTTIDSTTASWCRRATISTCSAARERTKNRSEWSSEMTTDTMSRAYSEPCATSMVTRRTALLVGTSQELGQPLVACRDCEIAWFR